MTINDVLTLLVALAAVVATFVAIWINNRVDQRAARSALTDLTIRISEKSTTYAKLKDEQDKYVACRELEVLIRQADDLGKRLSRIPDSVAIALAQALEQVADYWWADRYWQTLMKTDDSYFRAMGMKLWGLAIWTRGDRLGGWKMIDEALASLTERSVNAQLWRGDICLNFGNWVAIDGFDEQHPASYWYDRARQEYEQIPTSDLQRKWCLDRLTKAMSGSH